MNVFHGRDRVLDDPYIESRLPDFWYTDIECQAGFIGIHNSGNSVRSWNREEEVVVVVHDDECKKFEWIVPFHPKQAFNCFSCVCGIFEYRRAMQRV